MSMNRSSKKKTGITSAPYLLGLRRQFLWLFVIRADHKLKLEQIIGGEWTNNKSTPQLERDSALALITTMRKLCLLLDIYDIVLNLDQNSNFVNLSYFSFFYCISFLVVLTPVAERY